MGKNACDYYKIKLMQLELSKLLESCDLISVDIIAKLDEAFGRNLFILKGYILIFFTFLYNEIYVSWQQRQDYPKENYKE